eukprot:s1219_g3.t1
MRSRRTAGQLLSKNDVIPDITEKPNYIYTRKARGREYQRCPAHCPVCIALCGFDHVKNTAVFAAFDAADGEILSVFASLKFAVIGRDRLHANNPWHMVRM